MSSESGILETARFEVITLVMHEKLSIRLDLDMREIAGI